MQLKSYCGGLEACLADGRVEVSQHQQIYALQAAQLEQVEADLATACCGLAQSRQRADSAVASLRLVCVQLEAECRRSYSLQQQLQAAQARHQQDMQRWSASDTKSAALQSFLQRSLSEQRSRCCVEVWMFSTRHGGVTRYAAELSDDGEIDAGSTRALRVLGMMIYSCLTRPASCIKSSGRCQSLPQMVEALRRDNSALGAFMWSMCTGQYEPQGGKVCRDQARVMAGVWIMRNQMLALSNPRHFCSDVAEWVARHLCGKNPYRACRALAHVGLSMHMECLTAVNEGAVSGDDKSLRDVSDLAVSKTSPLRTLATTVDWPLFQADNFELAIKSREGGNMQMTVMITAICTLAQIVASTPMERKEFEPRRVADAFGAAPGVPEPAAVFYHTLAAHLLATAKSAIALMDVPAAEYDQHRIPVRADASTRDELVAGLVPVDTTWMVELLSEEAWEGETGAMNIGQMKSGLDDDPDSDDDDGDGCHCTGAPLLYTRVAQQASPASQQDFTPQTSPASQDDFEPDLLPEMLTGAGSKPGSSCDCTRVDECERTCTLDCDGDPAHQSLFEANRMLVLLLFMRNLADKRTSMAVVDGALSARLQLQEGELPAPPQGTSSTTLQAWWALVCLLPTVIGLDGNPFYALLEMGVPDGVFIHGGDLHNWQNWFKMLGRRFGSGLFEEQVRRLRRSANKVAFFVYSCKDPFGTRIEMLHYIAGIYLGAGWGFQEHHGRKPNSPAELDSYMVSCARRKPLAEAWLQFVRYAHVILMAMDCASEVNDQVPPALRTGAGNWDLHLDCQMAMLRLCGVTNSYKYVAMTLYAWVYFKSASSAFIRIFRNCIFTARTEFGRSIVSDLRMEWVIKACTRHTPEHWDPRHEHSVRRSIYNLHNTTAAESRASLRADGTSARGGAAERKATYEREHHLPVSNIVLAVARDQLSCRHWVLDSITIVVADPIKRQRAALLKQQNASAEHGDEDGEEQDDVMDEIEGDGVNLGDKTYAFPDGTNMSPAWLAQPHARSTDERLRNGLHKALSNNYSACKGEYGELERRGECDGMEELRQYYLAHCKDVSFMLTQTRDGNPALFDAEEAVATANAAKRKAHAKVGRRPADPVHARSSPPRAGTHVHTHTHIRTGEKQGQIRAKDRQEEAI